jgi:hypothetical protein
VTLSFAFTKQLVFEYFYPSFMYVAGWSVKSGFEGSFSLC